MWVVVINVSYGTAYPFQGLFKTKKAAIAKAKSILPPDGVKKNGDSWDIEDDDGNWLGCVDVFKTEAK